MRTAIWCAMLLAAPVLSYGLSAAQQSADPAPKTQQVLPPGESGVPLTSKPAAGAAQPDSTKPTPPVAPTNDETYLIGPEDVLQVTVWADPRLSGSFLVRSDGRISMNLIGELVATGKT